MFSITARCTELQHDVFYAATYQDLQDFMIKFRETLDVVRLKTTNILYFHKLEALTLEFEIIHARMSESELISRPCKDIMAEAVGDMSAMFIKSGADDNAFTVEEYKTSSKFRFDDMISFLNDQIFLSETHVRRLVKPKWWHFRKRSAYNQEMEAHKTVMRFAAKFRDVVIDTHANGMMNANNFINYRNEIQRTLNRILGL